MRRRFLASLLAIMMACTTLAGCSSNSGGGTESIAQDNKTNVEMAKNGTDTKENNATGEKTKLTALYVSHSLTKSLDEMQWMQELEDACGVEVEWEQIYQDWNTTKSTRLASGNIPDLLFNAVNNSDYVTYTGLFQDMSGLIEDYAPNIKTMFEEEPDTKTIVMNTDKEIFGLLRFRGKWPTTSTAMYINKQWLDRLGLEIPTTFSELEQVLLAFKEQDANGNGDPNDEIPLDFNAYGSMAWFNGQVTLTRLIGSMGIQLNELSTNGYFAENKEVKCYAVDERYKAFMKYFNSLYSHGLINTNAITNDYSMYQSLASGNEAGDAMVGFTLGYEKADRFGNELSKQYIPLAPLDYDIDCEAGTYDTRWPYDYDSANIAVNLVSMSAKCKDKEAAMRFIDGFYATETSIQVLFGGISDGCVERTGENSYKVLDPPDAAMDAGTWRWTNAFAGNGPMYIPRSVEIEMPYDIANAIAERVYYKEAHDQLSDSDYYPQTFLKYSTDDQNTLSVTQANINNIIDNYWALWLTGESDIDSDWDSYVQSVYHAGLQDVLDIRQAAYEEYLAK